MGQQTNIKRDSSFDIARALSALWIIGVWHLFCYDSSLAYANIYTQRITDIFLGCFMYISGYMLSKYKFSNMIDVWVFYKKRLARFYVLYFIALVSIYIAGVYINKPILSGFDQLVFSLLGVASFIPPHVGTFWFMTMIMFFYMITPLLMHFKEHANRVVCFLVVFGIYVLFYVWNGCFGYIEPYIFLFYPIYTLGLFTSREWINRIKSSVLATALLLGLSFVGLLIPNYTPPIKLFLSIFTSCVGTLSLLGMSEILSRSNWISIVMQWVAYSSLCAYLFHRQVYSLLHSLFNHFNIPLCLLTLWIVFLPCAFITSWIIQRIYDNIITSTKK